MSVSQDALAHVMMRERDREFIAAVFTELREARRQYPGSYNLTFVLSQKLDEFLQNEGNNERDKMLLLHIATVAARLFVETYSSAPEPSELDRMQRRLGAAITGDAE